MPARELRALWEKHCQQPYPEEIEQVQAIGPEWATRTKRMLHAAMPEYATLGYTVKQMLVMEMIQHEFAVKAAKMAGQVTLLCVEGMSGMGNLSKGFQRCQLEACRLDRKYSASCDFAQPKGIRNFIVCLRPLHGKGVAWYGVECSSWVWMSRSGTHRSSEFPEGDEKNLKVREANEVRDCIVFLMLLLHFTGRCFVIEQPCSSLLNASVPFEMALNISGSRIVSFDHAAYEDEEPEFINAEEEDGEFPAQKPLKVMGNCPWLPLLERRCRKDVKREKLTVREVVATKGSNKTSVTGKSNELKSSEHYCIKFGEHVARCHLEYLKQIYGEDVDLQAI